MFGVGGLLHYKNATSDLQPKSLLDELENAIKDPISYFPNFDNLLNNIKKNKISNFFENEGKTLLHLALEESQTATTAKDFKKLLEEKNLREKMALSLIDAGSNVYAKTTSYDTPFHYAVRFGKADAAQKILDRIENDQKKGSLQEIVSLKKDTAKKSTLHYLVELAKPELISKFILALENYLNQSLKNTEKKPVATLLTFINLTDDLGNTALHLLADTATRQHSLYTFEGFKTVADLLTKKGISVSVSNKNGKSAWQIAANKNGVSGEYLKNLEKIPPPSHSSFRNSRRFSSMSVLPSTAELKENISEQEIPILPHVVEEKINTKKISESNSSVEKTLESENKKEIETPQLQPKNIFTALKEPNHAEFNQLINDPNTDLTVVDDKDNTILHLLAQSDNTQLLKTIIEKTHETPLINALNKEQKTPLHIAIDSEKINNIKLLIRNKGTINSNGNTPLHAAALSLKVSVISCLLEEDEDPFLSCKTNNDGKFAIDLVPSGTGSDSAKILLKESLKKGTLRAAARGDIENLIKYPILYLDSKDEDGDTTLHLLAGQMDGTEGIRYLLDKNKELIKEKNKEMQTPLHIAISNTANSNAQILIDNGANVDDKDKNDNTALHLAVKFNHHTIIEKLLEKNLDIIDTINQDKKTPLDKSYDNDASKSLHSCLNNIFIAAIKEHKSGKVKKILSHPDFNLQVKDENGDTYLHIAIQAGNEEIINALLENKQLIEITNAHKQTPLHLAIDLKQSETAQLLINLNANIHCQDEHGNTPLHLAAKSDRNVALMAALITKDKKTLNAANTNKETPLHLAIISHATGAAQCLIRAGANLTATDIQGNTVLHLIVQHNTDTAIINDLINRNPELLHVKNTDNKTPQELVNDCNSPNLKKIFASKKFIESVKYNHLEEVTLLAELDLATQDINGNTAFHLAAIENFILLKILFKEVKTRLNQEGIVRLLSITNHNKQTILHCLLESFALWIEGEIKKIYENKNELDDKYQLENLTLKTHTKEILDLIISINQYKNLSNDVNKDGNTLLHLACQNRLHGIAKYLMKAGADINIKNNKHETPLHLLAKAGFGQNAENGLTIYKLLLGKKTNFTIKDSMGNTPLHYLIEDTDERSEKIFFMLIEKLDEKVGANLINNNGESLLHTATHSGRYKIAAYLTKHQPHLLDLRAGFSRTALHLAVLNWNILLIKNLLDAGADFNALDSHNQTPLHYAALAKHFEIIELFFDKNTPMHSVFDNSKGNNLLHMLCSDNKHFKFLSKILKSKQHAKTVQEFIVSTNIFNEIPLLTASRNGLWNMVALLMPLYQKLPIPQIDQVHYLDMPYILRNEETEEVKEKCATAIYYALSSNNQDITELFLVNGADITTPSYGDQSFLDMVIDKQQAEHYLKFLIAENCPTLNEVLPYMVQQSFIKPITCSGLIELMLNKLEYKNHINAKDKNKWTPLHHAIHLSTGKNIAIINVLLNYKADIYLTCPNEDTPLHLAARKNDLEIIQLLMNKCNNDNTKSSGFFNSKPLNVLSRLDYVSKKNELGNTALHEAIIHADGTTFLYVLDRFENDYDREKILNIRNKEGYTVLHLAMIHNRINTLGSRMKCADVTITSSQNETALDCAIINQRVESMSFFITQYAQPKIKDSVKKEAYSKIINYAVSLQNGFEIIKQLLKEDTPFLQTAFEQKELQSLLEKAPWYNDNKEILDNLTKDKKALTKN